MSQNPYYIPGWTAQNMLPGTPDPEPPSDNLPLPADIPMVTVTGNYISLDGDAWSSLIRFRVVGVSDDTTYKTFIMGTEIKSWLVSGALSVSLPAGFTYEVTECLPGGRTYSVVLPANATSPTSLFDLAVAAGV